MSNDLLFEVWTVTADGKLKIKEIICAFRSYTDCTDYIKDFWHYSEHVVALVTHLPSGGRKIEYRYPDGMKLYEYI